MPRVTVNGLRLDVETSGNGEPLVLVHGSWDDRRVWAMVEKDLARTFHVVVYDRRGHGGSEDSPDPGSRRADEDDLAGLIDALDLGPVHLVGNSFGASIALGTAARGPEGVRTVCAHEPPLTSLAADDPAVVQADRRVRAVVEQIEHGNAEAAARVFIEDVALGPGAWEAFSSEERSAMVELAGTFAPEQRDPAWADVDLGSLSAVGFPVLFTQGDQSPPFFAKVIARLADVIDGAEVRTLAGAGHVPHVTHPSEYVAALTTFLTR